MAHHTKLLEQEYDSVWLGGYSTGANLVTSQAMNDPKISGLLLVLSCIPTEFVCGSICRAGASYFVTWADQDPEDNVLRYNSLPMNGAPVYYETSEVVREDLQDKHFDKPVFIMMSEGDSVIDTSFVQQAFTESMPNPNNVLVWQGETTLDDPRSVQYSMKIPDQRISNGSIWACCSRQAIRITESMW